MHQGQARSLVRTRSSGYCEIAIMDVCTQLTNSLHHRRKPGRVWEPANLLAACGSGTTGCHGWVESHPKDAHELGLWIFNGDGVPSHVPVRLRTIKFGYVWVLLCNDGTFVRVDQ